MHYVKILNGLGARSEKPDPSLGVFQKNLFAGHTEIDVIQLLIKDPWASFFFYEPCPNSQRFGREIRKTGRIFRRFPKKYVRRSHENRCYSAPN